MVRNQWTSVIQNRECTSTKLPAADLCLVATPSSPLWQETGLLMNPPQCSAKPLDSGFASGAEMLVVRSSSRIHRYRIKPLGNG